MLIVWSVPVSQLAKFVKMDTTWLEDNASSAMSLAARPAQALIRVLLAIAAILLSQPQAEVQQAQPALSQAASTHAKLAIQTPNA